MKQYGLSLQGKQKEAIKLQLKVKCRSGEAIVFKCDGARFSASDSTVKLETGGSYYFVLTASPPLQISSCALHAECPGKAVPAQSLQPLSGTTSTNETAHENAVVNMDIQQTATANNTEDLLGDLLMDDASVPGVKLAGHASNTRNPFSTSVAGTAIPNQPSNPFLSQPHQQSPNMHQNPFMSATSSTIQTTNPSVLDNPFLAAAAASGAPFSGGHNPFRQTGRPLGEGHEHTMVSDEGMALWQVTGAAQAGRGQPVAEGYNPFTGQMETSAQHTSNATGSHDNPFTSHPQQHSPFMQPQQAPHDNPFLTTAAIGGVPQQTPGGLANSTHRQQDMGSPGLNPFTSEPEATSTSVGRQQQQQQQQSSVYASQSQVSLSSSQQQHLDEGTGTPGEPISSTLSVASSMKGASSGRHVPAAYMSHLSSLQSSLGVTSQASVANSSGQQSSNTWLWTCNLPHSKKSDRTTLRLVLETQELGQVEVVLLAKIYKPGDKALLHGTRLRYVQCTALPHPELDRRGYIADSVFFGLPS